MKLVIDIQKDVYRVLKEDIYPILDIERLALVFKTLVKKGTPLPDNATNGDIVQAVYPHYTFEIESFEGFVRCSYNGWYIRLPICWWDAPYKEGETN